MERKRGKKGEASRAVVRLPMYFKVAASLPTFSRSSLTRWWSVASKVFDRKFPNPSAVPWMSGNGSQWRVARQSAHDRQTLDDHQRVNEEREEQGRTGNAIGNLWPLSRAICTM